MQFMRDFNLDIDKDNIKIEELFNNYEGVPYEGIALYKITLDNDAKQDFLKCQKWAQKKQQIFFKTYCFAQCCGGITYIWFSS